ncbi:hypothetical protein MDAP_000857 [Mitosporidium daphniae]|uniref:Uncharacterized protein n=1 Tax=Mitosporidium daphniae TaxID=1485682 RepID=A0A098VRH4_9MICR|nr:uncharacterized protein DI09_37p110 [Mitosporidium daphniae]KGG51374.1 hypothetical protein DI09_37p110 [Mitosporidium daphniae]|eukprot:XP_013237801.1 uncharacterized protein DI09_37p110 [Mitosporidium daphniae]
MENAAFVDDFSCLLVRHFPKYILGASSCGKNGPINFEDLLLMVEEATDKMVLHVLNILRILFAPGKPVELDATCLVNTVEKYLHYLTSNTLIANGPKLPRPKDCTAIARALICGNQDLACSLGCALSLGDILDPILNEKIDFYRLATYIVSSRAAPKSSMPFFSFLSNAYFDAPKKVSDIDESYFVELEWPDICLVIFRRFAAVFQKESKSDIDSYQVVSAIVSFFDVQNMYSAILLYYLRIAYILKHPDESSRLCLVRKIPSPINRLLDDQLLFAAENSPQISFVFFLVTLQVSPFAYSEALASPQSLFFSVVSNQNISSDTVTCLILYGFVSRMPLLNAFSISEEGKLLFLHLPARFVVDDTRIRPFLPQLDRTCLFRNLLDVFSPCFGLSIDKLENAALIEMLCKPFCMQLAEKYYRHGAVHLREAFLKLPKEDFCCFVKAFSECSMALFLISEAVSSCTHELSNIQMFLFLISSTIRPPISELCLLSPFLNLLKDIIEAIGGPKAVPKILFFYQLFSAFYPLLASKENEEEVRQGSSKIEYAKTLGVLEYLGVDIPCSLQAAINVDSYSDYIYQIKRSIKGAIQDLELSHNYEEPEHLDPIPIDICNAWAGLLAENKIHSSPTEAPASHLFDHNIDRLLHNVPSDKDYKYYLLNCL